MVEKCFERLAVRPKRGDTLLFYNQVPNGAVDPAAHGNEDARGLGRYVIAVIVHGVLKRKLPQTRPGGALSDVGGLVVAGGLAERGVGQKGWPPRRM